MKYLVYISTAKDLFSEDQLIHLLTAARKKNAEHHVTGMLLYSEGTFIQALEGAEADVDKIYHAIENDRRHKNIILMITGTTETRAFPDWSMAFATLNPKALEQVKGYLGKNEQAFKSDDDHAAINMLKVFAETNNLFS